MISFFAVIGFTVAWCIFTLFLTKQITKIEVFYQILGSVVIATISLMVSYGLPEHDTEILNGSVISKKQERVSCSHSYDCDPYPDCSGSGANRNCVTKYRTCYEHSHDFDWDVNSSIGTFTIDRIDQRGSYEPPRWSQVNLGDPVSKASSYRSYIKGNPETLFDSRDNEFLLAKYAGKIPEYPSKIYDYYKVDRVLQVGINLPDKELWEKDLREFLKVRGEIKQVNVVPIFTNEDPEFAQAVTAAWIGGKKNDVVIIISMKAYPKIDWVDIISWTDKNIFKVSARDDLIATGNLDRVNYFKILGENIDKHFIRKSQEDFRFLEEARREAREFPVLIISLLVVLIYNLGASFVLHRIEI